jgi:hypothetical protein
MGFSGGGSNATQPHTHDSNIPNDGGALQFNNVTQGSMAAGDVTYSDGNHLQVLTYPAVPAGETLTAAAASTAPSWQAGGGAWTELGNVTSAVAVGELTLDVGDYDVYQVLYNCSCDASAGNSYMSAGINSVVTANYRSMWSYSSGGAFTTGTSNGATQWRINGSDLWNYATNNMFGTLFLYKPQAVADAIDMVSFRCINGNLSPSGSSYISTSFGSCLETDISSIQLKVDGADISGSFRVNGMNW